MISARSVYHRVFFPWVVTVALALGLTDPCPAQYSIRALEGNEAYPRAIAGRWIVGHQAGRPTIWDANTGLIVEHPCAAEGTASDITWQGTVCGYHPGDKQLPEAWYRPAGRSCVSMERHQNWYHQALSIVSDETAVVVVGELWDDRARRMRAVRWVNGALEWLPDLGSHASAQEINEHRQVAGYVADDGSPWDGRARACVWDADRNLALLSSLGGESVASSVSNSGWIAGRSALGMGDWPEWRAVRWGPNHVAVNLGVLEGDLHSVGLGVNSSGVVVGWSGMDPYSSRAFVFDWMSGMRPLAELVDDPSWNPAVAHDIDDLGRIIGWGYHNGEQRGFVAVPWVVVTENRP